MKTASNFRDAERRPLLFDGEEGRAKQAMKDECDVNVIVNRYKRSGMLPSQQLSLAQFFDAPAMDFREMLEAVDKASEAFRSLPASVRKEFHNDPVRLIEFCQDVDNRDRAIELGLIDPPVPEAPPQRVEIVNPPDDPAE